MKSRSGVGKNVTHCSLVRLNYRRNRFCDRTFGMTRYSVVRLHTGIDPVGMQLRNYNPVHPFPICSRDIHRSVSLLVCKDLRLWNHNGSRPVDIFCMLKQKGRIDTEDAQIRKSNLVYITVYFEKKLAASYG